MKNITHKEVLFTMKKRLLTTIISAMLIATMAVGLTGCGGETSGSTPDEAIQSTKQIETVVEFSTDDQGNNYNQEASSVANINSSNTEKEKSESTTSESSKSDSKKNNNKNSSSSSRKSNTSVNNANNNSSQNNSSYGTANQKSKSSTVAVTSVSLSKSSLSVTVGSSNSFNVTINPGNATNRNYTASTNNGNAAVSCSGSTVTVYGKSAGSCTITVTSSNGKTATCKVTVSNSKDAQARLIAQEIANASYKIAHKKNSNPSDLELVSIACELVSEYCNACTYTTSDSDYSTAYGVFIKRVYTCAGSVRALGMVLDCMGYSWKHVNENQWTHQWCELTMDGKKGWADAYNGYNAELAMGAGYGDYDLSVGDDVFKHFGWDKTTYVSGSEESGKIVYQLTTWKAYYGLGDEELIAYFDSNGNFIKRQQKINGTLYYEYNVTTGKNTYFKSTVDFL